MFGFGIGRGELIRFAVSAVRFVVAFVVAYYLSFTTLSTVLFWPSSTVSVLVLFGFTILFAGLFTYRRGSMELLGAYTAAVMLLFVMTAIALMVPMAFGALLGIDWQGALPTVLPPIWANRVGSAVTLVVVHCGAYYLVYRGGYSRLKRRVESATAD